MLLMLLKRLKAATVVLQMAMCCCSWLLTWSLTRLQVIDL